jgi:hypothetical protein
MEMRRPLDFGVRLSEKSDMPSLEQEAETPTVLQAIGATAPIGIAMFYFPEFAERREVFRTTVELK